MCETWKEYFEDLYIMDAGRQITANMYISEESRNLDNSMKGKGQIYY